MFFKKKKNPLTEMIVDTSKVKSFADWFCEHEERIRLSVEKDLPDKYELLDEVEAQLALVYRSGFTGNIEFDYGGKGEEWELNLYHLGDPFLISAVKQIQIELADRELPFWTVRCSP